MARTDHVLALLLVQAALAGTLPDAADSQLEAVFSEAERACLAEEKFLFGGKCYALTTQGPCDAGQWLVLNATEVVYGSGRLQAVCQPCTCCGQQLRVFMAEDGQCHHRVRERARFCPREGTELRNDVFGEGACMCSQVPGPHARLQGAPDDAACYLLFARGPCPAGRVLAPSGACETDPCASRGQGFARWDGDGQCYRLGSTPGPCGVEGSSFSVHPGTLSPECIVPTNNLAHLPNICSTSNSGACQPPVRMPYRGRAYGKHLLQTAEKYKSKANNDL